VTDSIMGKEIDEAESVAVSTIPYDRSDNKALFLGYRASGFTISEALHQIGCAHSTLSYWRKIDPDFLALEKRIPEFRKSLGIEYANLEFLRNYRLVLEKDFRVIARSLQKDPEGNPIALTYQEQQYLIKARSHYTPQQLQIMEALMAISGAGGDFNFTDMVVKYSREQGTIEIRGKKDGVSEVQSTDVSIVAGGGADIV
jgi:hypothetical protein